MYQKNIYNFIVIYTFEFHQIFMGFEINSFKKYKNIYDQLKIYLKDKLIMYFISIRKK